MGLAVWKAQFSHAQTWALFDCSLQSFLIGFIIDVYNLCYKIEV